MDRASVPPPGGVHHHITSTIPNGGGKHLGSRREPYGNVAGKMIGFSATRMTCRVAAQERKSPDSRAIICKGFGAKPPLAQCAHLVQTDSAPVFCVVPTRFSRLALSVIHTVSLLRSHTLHAVDRTNRSKKISREEGEPGGAQPLLPLEMFLMPSQRMREGAKAGKLDSR